MSRLHLALPIFATLAVYAGCQPNNPAAPGSGTPATAPGAGAAPPRTLADVRKGFVTRLVKQVRSGAAVEEPPAEVFRKVKYDSPVGPLAAYLTPDPKDGKKHPAIVWITGGDCNTIGDVWSPANPSNDQTARQYRDAGVVMMFPSLRGGNDNPGTQENFYGEVDDVIAAAEYLAKQEYVDPARIYLGGHSTGGTLALLVAEMPNKFRAVFSFGPVERITDYGGQFADAIDMNDGDELEVRSPGNWLHSIQCPTFVIEGADGNARPHQNMARYNFNPKVTFYLVRGTNHFAVLAPVNALIAKKLLRDIGTATNLAFTEAELSNLFGR